MQHANEVASREPHHVGYYRAALLLKWYNTAGSNSYSCKVWTDNFAVQCVSVLHGSMPVLKIPLFLTRWLSVCSYLFMEIEGKKFDSVISPCGYQYVVPLASQVLPCYVIDVKWFGRPSMLSPPPTPVPVPVKLTVQPVEMRERRQQQLLARVSCLLFSFPFFPSVYLSLYLSICLYVYLSCYLSQKLLVCESSPFAAFLANGIILCNVESVF